MNVFVLCTGRCGSVSFIEACREIHNFSAGHETQAGMVGERRIDYPKNHIEADNRLCWYLGRLHFAYGSKAFYVHLQRDLRATAESYAARKSVGIMNAFAAGILRKHNLAAEARDPETLAREICETMDANIRHFLLDKPNKLEIQLEHFVEGFGEFWTRIGAEGDHEEAIKKLGRRHNSLRDFQHQHENPGLYARAKASFRGGVQGFMKPYAEKSIFQRAA